MNIQINDNTRNSLDFNLFNVLDTTMLINEHYEENNEDNIKQLSSMGFDIKMIKKVYVLLKPRNLDEAIYLLTQDNEKYHHYFIQRHGKEDECFICGLKSEKHINFVPKEKLQNNSTNNKKIDKSDNKFDKELKGLSEPLIKKDESSEPLNKQKLFCGVCEEELTQKEKKENVIPCNHLFCTGCYIPYFERKITENEVSSITCMQFGCNQEIDEAFIRNHIGENKELFDKYLKFKKRNEIDKDKNKVSCPIENCESYAVKEENNKFVKCLKGHKFCSECKTKWHKGKDCDTNSLIELFKDYHLKKCPTCGALTEKKLGCNHMKCKCGTHWCWFCKKAFKSEKEHYGVNGPCSNLHYTFNDMYNYGCILCIHNTWIEVMHNFILLFIITSTCASFFLRKIKKDLQDKSFKKLLKFMIFLRIVYSISYCGLFFVIGFPVFLFCNIVRSIKRKIIRYVLDLDDNEL